MIEEKWTPLKQLLKEESNFYHDTIQGMGVSYQSILNSYNHVGPEGYRSRGYPEAKQLLELFSVFVPEEPNESESGHFPRLLGLTEKSVPYLPMMDVELEIMRRLRSTYIEPMKDLIYKKVPDRIEEYEGRMVLSPEEVTIFLEDADAIITYYQYRAGRSYLNFGHFANGVEVKDLVKKFLPSTEAFARKWGGHWVLYSGDSGIDQFGFINLMTVDSEDNSTVSRTLEATNPGKVISEYVPRQGLNKVIFAPGRPTLRARIRNSLIKGTHTEECCIPNMLKKRGNQGKMLKYLRKVKKKAGVDEKTTSGVV